MISSGSWAVQLTGDQNQSQRVDAMAVEESTV